jgi:hypothetical protein
MNLISETLIPEPRSPLPPFSAHDARKFLLTVSKALQGMEAADPAALPRPVLGFGGAAATAHHVAKVDSVVNHKRFNPPH